MKNSIWQRVFKARQEGFFWWPSQGNSLSVVESKGLRLGPRALPRVRLRSKKAAVANRALA